MLSRCSAFEYLFRPNLHPRQHWKEEHVLDIRYKLGTYVAVECIDRFKTFIRFQVISWRGRLNAMVIAVNSGRSFREDFPLSKKNFRSHSRLLGDIQERTEQFINLWGRT